MNKNLILLASDHAGFELKDKILKSAQAFGVEFLDLGTLSEDSVDYNDYAKKLCSHLLEGKAHRGILICGSGQGMAIQANRFKGIRAALCWNTEVAKLSREHNNANVLCLAGRLVPHPLSIEIAKVWLHTEFAGGRHLKRTEKFDQNEP